MSDEPFDLQAASDRLALVCGLIDGIELEQMRTAIGRADALGPFLDPTAYRDMLDRPGNMHEVGRLIQPAIALRDAYRELVARVEKAEAARAPERSAEA